MQDVTRSYRLLSNLERDELLESGHEEYSKLYREISEKYLDQNILVPQHLNPFASEQKQKVHKKLWEQALNERKTSKQNVALDKEFSQFRSRKTKEIRIKLREKYEFHPDLTFKYSAYNLFLADLRKSRKNESFRELMPKTKNWREINDSVVVANFDRQSKRLREKYDAQNKAGALLALRNEEWLALKVLKSFEEEKYCGIYLNTRC